MLGRLRLPVIVVGTLLITAVGPPPRVGGPVPVLTRQDAKTLARHHALLLARRLGRTHQNAKRLGGSLGPRLAG